MNTTLGKHLNSFHFTFLILLTFSLCCCSEVVFTYISQIRGRFNICRVTLLSLCFALLCSRFLFPVIFTLHLELNSVGVATNLSVF